MKKITDILLGVWSAVSCFISPIWLTLMFVNITGLVYKYDFTMDEGTAIIFGIAFLVLWILLALLPNLVFIKRLYMKNKKYALVDIAGMVILMLACVGFCGWNIIDFLF